MVVDDADLCFAKRKEALENNLPLDEFWKLKETNLFVLELFDLFLRFH